MLSNVKVFLYFRTNSVIMKRTILLIIAFSSLLVTNAQTVNWALDIAPILYSNCTKCHHQGGLAPFSLVTYNEAFANRFNISTAVSDGTMPPWPPDRNYKHYTDERYLTNDQVTKINSWASNGAPEGNPNDAPATPVYLNGSTFNQIDKVIQMPTFTVPGNVNYDLYQCFTVPTGLTQDEFITGFEVIPGNPSIVHHLLVFEDTTGQSVTLDNNTPEPGYTSFGGPGFQADLVGGWVPGTVPTVYPNGMGVKIHKNSRLVMQIHYPAGSQGKSDSTKINLKLSTGNLRTIMIQPPINHSTSMTDGPLHVPANSTKTFHAEYTIPTNIPIAGVSVLNVAPHAHLICKSWLVFGKTPTGDTIPFVKIDNWDFHWQGFYTFQTLQFMPKGSTFYGIATYDNTINNPHNPNATPQAISVGESTTDEMMMCYFSYLYYKPGDENFIVDSSLLNNSTDIENQILPENFVTTPQLYDAMPNPTSGITTLQYFLPNHTDQAEIKIFDFNGKLVEKIKVPATIGFSKVEYNTSLLPTGTYIFSLNADGKTKSKQLIVTR